MFGKLQAQAKEVTQLKCTLAKVAVQAESATRLEGKLELLQDRLDEVLGPPGSESLLSPFKQQVMLDELGHLKTVVASHTLTIDGTVADISKVRQSCYNVLHEFAKHQASSFTLMKQSCNKLDRRKLSVITHQIFKRIP